MEEALEEGAAGTLAWGCHRPSGYHAPQLPDSPPYTGNPSPSHIPAAAFLRDESRFLSAPPAAPRTPQGGHDYTWSDGMSGEEFLAHRAARSRCQRSC